MYVPTGSHSIEQRIKNSRFIAQAEPFTDLRGVKQRVEEIRAANPGCAHVVHAVSVGDAQSRSFGMSDDGEPHGTSGRPALEVLRGSEITNCLVTIVRYFGGTKLGTGGLVRAYGGATKEVLAGLPVEALVEKRRFSVTLPYELYEPLRKLLIEHGAAALEEQFAEEVSLSGEIPAAEAGVCRDAVRDLSRARVELGLGEATDV